LASTRPFSGALLLRDVLETSVFRFGEKMQILQLAAETDAEVQI
jgi:hypothetical protein